MPINHCDVGTGLCVPDLCNNHALDTGETDKDCGGASCPKCANGLNCVQNSDCQSDYCSSTKQCGVSPCKNGAKDGAETDVDCGGGTCAGCASGKACLADTDCATTFCNTSKVCAADPCQDATKDQNETDVDCGGGPLAGTTHSCPKCASQKACAVGTDCASGTCLSSLHCDGPCAAVCTPAAGDAQVISGGWASPSVGGSARCFELLTGTRTLSGQISNLGSRVLTVDGTAATDFSSALQTGPKKGGYCIQIAAGTPDYTSFSVW